MPTDSTERTRIMLVCFNGDDYFNWAYESLKELIERDTTLHRAYEADTTFFYRLRSNSRPLAVLIIDDALTLEQNSDAWEAVLQYVREGGTAIFLTLFPNYCNWPNLTSFFTKVGLPWIRGWYATEKVAINRDAVRQVFTETLEPLPSQYRQRALWIGRVAEKDAWYVADSPGHSGVQSEVSGLPGACPVFLTDVGDGKLGFIGLANPTDELTNITMVMSGVWGWP